MLDIINQHSIFVASSAEAGGISSLGIDAKLLVLQIITFIIVFWILKRYAFGPIINILDERYKRIESSIDNAEKLAKQNELTEEKSREILRDARAQAEETITRGREEATQIVKDAEESAQERADKLIENAHTKLEGDVIKARESLKKDMLDMVKDATAIVLTEKVNDKQNDQLISRALGQLSEENR